MWQEEEEWFGEDSSAQWSFRQHRSTFGGTFLKRAAEDEYGELCHLMVAVISPRCRPTTDFAFPPPGLPTESCPFMRHDGALFFPGPTHFLQLLWPD